MNHDISHCVGIKECPECKDCLRRLAHEDLQSLVRQGKSPSGKVYQYIKSDDCEDCDYGMRLVKEGRLV